MEKSTQETDKKKGEEAIYSILTRLSLQPPLPNFIQYAQIAVCLVQKISFSLTMAYPWPTAETHFIISLLGYSRLKMDMSLQTLTLFAWLSFALYSAAMVYLPCLFYLQSNHGSSIPPFRYTRILLDLLFKTLQMPAMYCMAKYMSCGIYNTCPEGSVSLLMVTIQGMGILLFLMLGTLYEALIYDWEITSHDILAHSSYRTPTVLFLSNSLVALLFGFIEEQSNQYYILVSSLFNLGQNIGNVFLTWVDLPYIHSSTNSLLLCSHSLSSWAAAMAVLSVTMYSAPPTLQDSGAVYSLIFGFFLVIPSSLYLWKARYGWIKHASFYDLESVPEIDIKTRILERCILDYQQGIGIHVHHHYQQGELEEEEEDEGEDEGEGEDMEESQVFKKKQKEMVEATFQEVDHMFSNVVKRIPEPCRLNFAWSAYGFNLRKHFLFSIAKLKEVLKESPSLMDQWTAEVRLRQMMEKTSYLADVEKYLEQSILESQSNSNAAKCLKQQFVFLKTLYSSSLLSEKEADKVVTTIDSCLTLCQAQLERLIYLNPTSPFHRRLYAQYLINLANDEPSANLQILKAFDLEHGGRFVRTEDIGDKNNGIIVMSGERGHVGEILQVNLRLCQFCGYNQSDLVGKKLNMLMPLPYAEVHHEWITRYVDMPQKTASGVKRTLIMKHNQGFVFFADIMVREYPSFTSQPSVIFLGVVYPHDSESMFSVVKVDNNQVQDISASWADLFPASLSNIVNGQVYMTEWIPGFDTIKAEAIEMLNTSSKPFAIVVDRHTGSERLPLLLRFSFLPYLPKKYFIVYIDLSEIPKGSFSMSELPERQGEAFNKKKITFDAPGVSFRSFSRMSGMNQAYSMGQSGILASREQIGRAVRESRDLGKAPKINMVRLSLNKLNSIMDPSIRRVARGVQWSLLLICIFSGVAHYVWANIVLQQLQNNISLIFIEATVRWALMTCSYLSLLYQTIPTSSSPSNLSSTASFDVSQILLNSNKVVSTMDSFTTQIQNMIPSLTGSSRTFFMSSQVEVANLLGQTQNMSMLDALSVYATNVALISNGGMAALSENKAQFQFFTNNYLNQELLSLVNSSVFSFQAQQQFNNQLADYSSLAFLVSALVLMVLLILGLILPAIISARRQRQQVFHLFFQIPAGNIRELISLCAEKLLQYSGQEMIFDDYEMGEFVEDNNNNNRTMKRMLEDHDFEGEGWVRRWISQAQLAMKEHAGRKTLWLLLFVALYYISNHVWWSIRKDVVLNDVASRLNWAGYRRMLSRQLTMNFLQQDPATGLPRLDLQAIQRVENMLWNVEQAVVYGDPTFSIFSDVTHLVHPEAFLRQNACAGSLAATMPTQQCMAYKDCLLTRGSHELVLNFLSESAELRDLYTQTLSLIYRPPTAWFNTSIDTSPYAQPIQSLVNRIHDLQQMADVYLFQVVSLGSSSLLQDFNNEINNMIQIRLILLILFICFMLASYFVLFQSTIKDLHRVLKRTRALLQIIPMDLFESSSTLKQALFSILNNEKTETF